MKTLSGSCLKLFTSSQREKERVVWWSREIAFRQEIGFLVHRKRVRDGFSLAVSFQPKFVRSISAVSSAQTNVESEEIQTISSDQPKTVNVRFKLHKECAFGQQFLIVGDDPILGLWNPTDGVPLNWSEGHVWTVEVDIPSGKVIKYKFVLKGNTGTISWQPGPDRILETWATEKTISVSEDWDSPELQNIVEEELVADMSEESLIDSDLSMVAENLNQTVVEEGDDAMKELTNADDLHSCSDMPSVTLVAENISEELEEQDLSSSDSGSGLMSVTDKKHEEMSGGNNGRVASGSNLSSLNDETRLVLDGGGPVLVPGLVPMPPDEIEVDEVAQVENNIVENTTTDSDEIEDSTEPELKDEHVSASLHSTETSGTMIEEKQHTITQSKDEHVSASLHSTETSETMIEEKQHTNTQSKDEHVSASLHSTETSEMMVDEKQQIYGKEQLESNILESDMQWGLRTLQKFLANLGFI